MQSLAQICLTSSARFSPTSTSASSSTTTAENNNSSASSISTTSCGRGFSGGLFPASFFRLARSPLAMRRCFPIAERLLLLAKVEAPADCVALAVWPCLRLSQLPPVAPPVWAKFGFSAMAETLSSVSYNFISWQQCHGACGRFFRASLARYVYVFMYVFVYSRDVGLCLLGFCYAADLIFSLSAGVCVLMCVLARVCLCYWEDMPRSLTSGKKK